MLGPGDVISIKNSIDGSETKAPILPNGTAVINYAGVIDAAGLSIDEISKLVNESAKKWFVSPHLVISLDRTRPTQIYLLGEIAHPGLYSPDSTKDNPGAVSSAKKSFTISEALEMAGGLKANADINQIHVTRLHPRQVIDVDLWKLMLDGDKTEDLS